MSSRCPVLSTKERFSFQQSKSSLKTNYQLIKQVESLDLSQTCCRTDPLQIPSRLLLEFSNDWGDFAVIIQSPSLGQGPVSSQ